jgi:hypothetical protein
MKTIYIDPIEVYNESGIRVVLIGKSKKKHDSSVFHVFRRDALNRLWCSDNIFISNELISDPETNHIELLIEVANNRFKSSIRDSITTNN